MSETAVDKNAVSGTITDLKPHQQFIAYLGRRAESEKVNRAHDVAASQIDRILSATTEEEIWAADEGGVVSGQNMEDVELQIRGYGVAKSDDKFDTDLGVYVLMDCIRLDTGESVVVNTGSALIITKLRMFEQRDAFPIEGVIKGQPTSNGGRLLRLRPLPTRAIAPRAASVE